MLKALYVVVGLLIVGGYAYAGYRGLEISTAQRSAARPGMRGAAGTSRVFWYGGYRGGK
jgi:hypothetical protein